MAARPGDTGYSAEEEYFYRRNKELIEKRRKELDEKRAEESATGAKSEHWMKCPKCGTDMEEITLSGILVDCCPQCKGVFFERDELATVLESREQGGFLSGLSRLFK